MKQIRSILTRSKTPVSVQDDVTYKQVTIRTNYKGVVLRGTKLGADIGTKNQWRVAADQFILSRIDARNGAFGIIPAELDGAIVTNDFLAFDINESEVEREFFNVFLQSPVFLDACIKASKGNTNRKRVDESFFLDFEVNLPPFEEQHQLIQKINKARAAIETATHEIAHQQTLLGKLKQAILQEAIQGKLTAEWRAANPDVESSAHLLSAVLESQEKWIAAEIANGNREAKTIQRKRTKIDKTPPVKPDTRLPDKWEWATLFDAGLLVIDCYNKTPPYVETGIPLIRTTNIRNGIIDVMGAKRVTEETYQNWSTRCVPAPGDLIFTREAPVGEVGIIPENETVCLGQRTMLIRPAHEHISKEYLLLAIRAPDFLQRAAAFRRGAMVGHLRVGDVERAFIPIPPKEEQAAIVERVEALMATCRELEAEIERSRTHAADLLQAVLKEAFAPAP